MATRTFEKTFRGQSVFACGICGRKTRNVGDNGAAGLCPECDESSMIENGISDGLYADGKELDDAESMLQALNQRAVNKGGVIEGYAAKAKP